MDLVYLATFVVAFLSSILSGLAGGGGGFIMAPYWLISGMTPAQGATIGAFMALGMGSSSLAAFKGSQHMPRNKQLVALFLLISLVSYIIGSLFLRSIHTEVFKPLIAFVTIASLPLLFIKRDTTVLLGGKKYGLVFMVVLLLVSSFITSSAFSILMSIVLVRSFNLTILQSTAIRRIIGLAQSTVTFVILCFFGNLIIPHAIAALMGGILGSYIGTKFSLKRGDKFARYALAAGALISSIALVS